MPDTCEMMYWSPEESDAPTITLKFTSGDTDHLVTIPIVHLQVNRRDASGHLDMTVEVKNGTVVRKRGKKS